jgi:hypothetical protein
MKQTRLVLVALVTILAFSPVSAFGAVKSGTTCKPVGSTKVSSGLKYTCIKSKGKLVWNKGVPVPKQSPISEPQPVASESPTPVATESSSPEPTTSPTVNVMIDVTAGAFCTPAGALGKTKTGLSVTCKTSATDTRNRWRQ